MSAHGIRANTKHDNQRNTQILDSKNRDTVAVTTLQKNTRSPLNDDRIHELQSLGLCHEQRDLEKTQRGIVENERATHLGIDGKQHSMPRSRNPHLQ